MPRIYLQTTVTCFTAFGEVADTQVEVYCFLNVLHYTDADNSTGSGAG